MIINKVKFSVISSISLISLAIISSFNGCGYDKECCTLAKSPTAVISGFTDKEIIEVTTAANQPIFLSVNGNSSFDDGNVTSYEWFVNGASVANTMIGNLEVNLGRNEICLVVADDENNTNKTCQDVIFKRPNKEVVEPEPKPEPEPEPNLEPELTCQQKPSAEHADPIPKLTLTDDTNNIVTDNMLEASTQYSLSCAGSVDDCGDDVKNCEWGATSYKLNPDGTKIPYVVDCFEDTQHTGHGEKFTTTDSLPSNIKLCGNTENFTNVEVSLKVTDEYNRTTTTTEIYTVQP